MHFAVTQILRIWNSVCVLGIENLIMSENPLYLYQTECYILTNFTYYHIGLKKNVNLKIVSGVRKVLLVSEPGLSNFQDYLIKAF